MAPTCDFGGKPRVASRGLHKRHNRRRVFPRVLACVALAYARCTDHATTKVHAMCAKVAVIDDTSVRFHVDNPRRKIQLSAFPPRRKITRAIARAIASRDS